LRPFLVQAPGQRGKTFGFEHFTHGGWTQRDFSLFENLADFVDGVILLPKRDDEVTGRRFFGLGPWPGAGTYEKARAGITQEAVAEDAKGARGIPEGLGRLGGREALDVIGSKRLVLSLFGMLGLEKEAARIC
jgi:hypothetical protein